MYVKGYKSHRHVILMIALYMVSWICDLIFFYLLFTVISYLLQLHVYIQELGIANYVVSSVLHGQLTRGLRKSSLERNLTVVRSVGNVLIGNRNLQFIKESIQVINHSNAENVADLLQINQICVIMNKFIQERNLIFVRFVGNYFLGSVMF